MALGSRLLGYFSGHVIKLDGPYSFSVPVSIALNAIGLVFLLFASITFNFPSTYPVNHESMNYTSAAIGVVALLSIVTWITTGKKNFTGPGAVSFLTGHTAAADRARPQEIEEKKS
jgi:ammonia channel protein AmtB